MKIEPGLGLLFFVPFYRSLLLRMRVIANLYDFGFVDNECQGVINFNDLLLIGSSITLLPVRCVNRYLCHLWRTHLMSIVVIYYMDDAGFYLFLLYNGRGSFFSSSVAPLFLPPHLWTQWKYERSNHLNFHIRYIYCESRCVSFHDTCCSVIAQLLQILFFFSVV